MDFAIVLSLLGGLGLFLYGMRVMSDSIEAYAGARLRSILEGSPQTGLWVFSSACSLRPSSNRHRLVR